VFGASLLVARGVKPPRTGGAWTAGGVRGNPVTPRADRRGANTGALAASPRLKVVRVFLLTLTVTIPALQLRIFPASRPAPRLLKDLIAPTAPANALHACTVGRTHVVLAVQRLPVQFQLAPPAETVPCLRALLFVMAIYFRTEPAERCACPNEGLITGLCLSEGVATCGVPIAPGGGSVKLYGEPAIAIALEKRNMALTVTLIMAFIFPMLSSLPDSSLNGCFPYRT